MRQRVPFPTVFMRGGTTLPQRFRAQIAEQPEQSEIDLPDMASVIKAAQLVESAAFEVAGKVDSEVVGAMIEIASELQWIGWILAVGRAGQDLEEAPVA